MEHSTGLQFDDKVNRGLQALYRTTDAARRRQAVLDALQLQSGECVLDIGCGPGFLAAEMAKAVGPLGRIHGMDTSDSMLTLARARCASHPQVDFETGDATRLPVGDASFDAAISVQVYEYVLDVMATLAELHRILRPGGRAVVVSTDWDAIAWQSSDKQRMQRVLDAFTEHCAHSALPRTLAAKLRQTGFAVHRQLVIPQFNPAYDPDSYSFQIARLIARFVPGRKGVTAEEAGEWLEDLQQTDKRGEYFFSLNQYLCVIEKTA
jgi:arsenite methyltransferase